MLWLNDMRILAALAIIFVHTTQPFLDISNEKDSLNWWISNFYLASSMWGVPVFVMISGALLLTPEREYQSIFSFYSKRLQRLFLPILFWTIIYLILLFIKNKILHIPFDIHTLGEALLSGRPYYHMWYLYMIIGLYLIAPFIRKIVKHSTKEELIFLAILLMFLSILTTSYTNPHAQPIFLFLFPFYLGYFLTGYLILSSSIKIPLTYLILFFIVLVCTIAIGEYYFPDQFKRNFSISMILLSITLMFIIKDAHYKIPISSKFRNKLATFSLGAYLIHPAVLIFIRKINYFGLHTGDHIWALILFTALLTILISVSIAYVFSKIVFLRKVI